jgi:cytochrome c553
LTRSVVGIAAFALLLAEAAASGPKFPAVTNDAWKAECGSCHAAYPPRLLSASSWRAIMHGLDRHFGVDATIDTAVAESIRNFLETNAGSARSTAPGPVPRITETSWFLHEHDGISPAVWRNPNVKSPANCGACHPAAENGRFGEHDVRIPRGASLSLR